MPLLALNPINKLQLWRLWLAREALVPVGLKLTAT
jgi:hypothetical protein